MLAIPDDELRPSDWSSASLSPLIKIIRMNHWLRLTWECLSLWEGFFLGWLSLWKGFPTIHLNQKCMPSQRGMAFRKLHNIDHYWPPRSISLQRSEDDSRDFVLCTILSTRQYKVCLKLGSSIGILTLKYFLHQFPFRLIGSGVIVDFLWMSN